MGKKNWKALCLAGIAIVGVIAAGKLTDAVTEKQDAEYTAENSGTEMQTRTEPAGTEESSGKEEKQEESGGYTIQDVPDSEEGGTSGERMSRDEIRGLENAADDNISLPDADDMEVTFTGLDDPAFDWMDGESKERFRKELKGYLRKKELEVTEANLHPDSIQVIDNYTRYVYLDVNYQTEYADRLVIKAVCDTYQKTLRFSFEIQYGS